MRNLTADGTLTDDDLAMIPIYIGVGDEANQGLCTGTENYWCVNNQADEADIQATLDFMNWCVTSETRNQDPWQTIWDSHFRSRRAQAQSTESCS